MRVCPQQHAIKMEKEDKIKNKATLGHIKEAIAFQGDLKV